MNKGHREEKRIQQARLLGTSREIRRHVEGTWDLGPGRSLGLFYRGVLDNSSTFWPPGIELGGPEPLLLIPTGRNPGGLYISCHGERVHTANCKAQRAV